MATKPYEEYRLLRLLNDFDTNTALYYLDRVRKATKLLEQKGFSDQIELIKDTVSTDPIGFRIPLKESLFILLSHPICRFGRKISYPKQLEWMRYFIAQLAMVPVYLVNQNNISILKLWGEDSRMVVSKPFIEQLQKGNILLELPPSSKPAQYSSMNFVLQYGSDSYQGDNLLLDTFQKYYQYGFWSPQITGFSYSSHFLHRTAKITAFLSVTKGLFTIKSIGRDKRVEISNRFLNCKELELDQFLFVDGNIKITKGIKAFAPLDIIAELQQKNNEGNFFVNGLMVELKTELGRLSLLTNIVEIGESSFDLIAIIVGMLTNYLYYRSERPCLVCNVDEFKIQVKALFADLFRHIELSTTISDRVNNFEFVIPSLYPFIVIDGNNVFFTHPIILEFISKQGKKELLEFQNQKSLVGLLSFIEKIFDSNRTMDIFLDPRMDEFRGRNKSESMRELRSISKQILFYKYLNRVFNETPENMVKM